MAQMSAVTPESGAIIYVAASGDNLSLIAWKYGVHWQDIYEMNKAVIGGDPRLIFPGQKLTINAG